MKKILWIIVIICLSIFYSDRLLAEVCDSNKTKLTVSVNTLGIITLNPNIDFEIKMNSKLSIGATCWWEIRDIADRWAQVKLSYYPIDYTFETLQFSLSAGYHKAYKKDKDPKDTKSEAESFTLGILASYNWTLHNDWGLFISPVVGAKKSFLDNYDNSPLESIIPEARLNIGFRI